MIWLLAAFAWGAVGFWSLITGDSEAFRECWAIVLLSLILSEMRD